MKNLFQRGISGIKSNKEAEKKRERREMDINAKSWGCNISHDITIEQQTKRYKKRVGIYVQAARERSYTNNTSCYIQTWRLFSSPHVFTSKVISRCVTSNIMPHSFLRHRPPSLWLGFCAASHLLISSSQLFPEAPHRLCMTSQVLLRTMFSTARSCRIKRARD